MTPRERNELYTELREEGEPPPQKPGEGKNARCQRAQLRRQHKVEFRAQLFGRLPGYGGLRWAWPYSSTEVVMAVPEGTI